MKQSKSKKSTFTFNTEQMLLNSKASFVVKEAFKTLRTNVMFSLPGNDCKCIGVTSGDRSEGKSLTSINLALSFAQIGKRVILIDCDLRIPSIAAKLSFPNKVGLSNYLVGTENDDQVKILHFGDPSIDIVPSGSIPPDPTALLGSEAMKEMLGILKKYYDYIILDFPPVSLVSDAVLLSDCVDGYLLVVRQNSSEFSKINETISQMEFANAKIIGFVYNAKLVDSIGKKNKYYKYYQYYK